MNETPTTPLLERIEDWGFYSAHHPDSHWTSEDAVALLHELLDVLDDHGNNGGLLRWPS